MRCKADFPSWKLIELEQGRALISVLSWWRLWWVATGGPFRTLANPFRISFACIMTRVLSCLVWKPLFNSMNARRYNKPENVVRFLLQCAQTRLPYLWKKRPFPSVFSIVHFVYCFLSLFFIASNFCTNFMWNIWKLYNLEIWSIFDCLDYLALFLFFF